MQGSRAISPAPLGRPAWRPAAVAVIGRASVDLASDQVREETDLDTLESRGTRLVTKWHLWSCPLDAVA